MRNLIAKNQFIEINKIENHFIYSFLDLASKFNSKWNKIYRLFYPCSYLVNCYILKRYGILEYITFDKVKQEMFQVDPCALIVKYDLKNTF